MIGHTTECIRSDSTVCTCDQLTVGRIELGTPQPLTDEENQWATGKIGEYQQAKIRRQESELAELRRDLAATQFKLIEMTVLMELYREGWLVYEKSMSIHRVNMVREAIERLEKK